MGRKRIPFQKTKDRDMANLVYDSLSGQLLPGYHVPWVKDIFVPGQPCYAEYERMLRAYARLCQRLGAGEEDPDGEEMIDALLAYGRLLALEMFRCGMEYQKQADSE